MRGYPATTCCCEAEQHVASSKHCYHLQAAASRPASHHVPCVLLLALQRFAAVIMRIREPKTTALIFASGKMVCTGAKSEAESRLAAKKVGLQTYYCP